MACAAILISFYTVPAGAAGESMPGQVPDQPLSSLSRLARHLSSLQANGPAASDLVHLAQLASQFAAHQMRDKSTALGLSSYQFSANIDGDWYVNRDDRRTLAVETTNQFDIDDRIALGVAVDFKYSKKTTGATQDIRTRDRWTVEPFVAYQLNPSTTLRYFAGVRMQREDVRTTSISTRSDTTKWVTGAKIGNEWQRGAWRVLPQGAINLSQAAQISDNEANRKTEAEAEVRTKVSYRFLAANIGTVFEPYGEASTMWIFETLRSVDPTRSAKFDEAAGALATGLKIAARDLPVEGHIKARYEGIGEADDGRWTLGGNFSLTF